MRILGCVLIAIMASILPNILLANAVNSSNQSPLTPGARLIAGDLSRNEFYILDKEQPKNVAATSPTSNHSQFSRIAKMNVALHQVDSALYKSISVKKINSPQVIHQAENSKQVSKRKAIFYQYDKTNNKSTRKVKTASIKSFITDKKNLSNAKTVLRQYNTHLSSKQNLSHKKIKTATKKGAYHHWAYHKKPAQLNIALNKRTRKH